MQIFKKDFKFNLKSLLIWSVIISALLMFYMSIYDSMIGNNAKMFDDIFNQMPEGFSEMFHLNTLDMSKPLEFYAMEGFLFLTLIGGMFAASLGIRLLAGEEKDGTTEFILSKPITRQKYVLQKMLTMIVNVAIFNIFAGIATVVGLKLGTAKPVDMNVLFLLQIGAFLLNLCFSFIGFFIGSIIKRGRAGAGVATGLVFGSYFISIMSTMADQLKSLKYFSLFEYVNPANIVRSGKLEINTFILFFSIIFIFGIASVFVYRKKDIF